MHVRRLVPLLVGAVLAAPDPTPAAAQTGGNDPELQEWTVPYAASRPRDPYVAPDGKVWFVGQRSDYVASFNPATGEFRRFDLEPGAGPHNLVVADDGTVWYAGNRASHIGRLDPETGEITKHMMPDERARDPHTLELAADGSLWFTVQGGNMIGHFDPAVGHTRLVEAPEVPGGRSTSSRPYGIKLDSRGHPWVVLFNTNKIARVDPATMELDVHELPENARPRRLVIDSHDRVWYVDYAQGKLGSLEPATGAVREWDAPAGPDSRPYGVAIDEWDRIWFVETGVAPNRLVGFDPATESFLSVAPIESGAGAVRHMYYDAETRTIWFGTDANTLGRALVPVPRRGVS